MKKYLFISVLMFALSLTGCANSGNGGIENTNTESGLTMTESQNSTVSAVKRESSEDISTLENINSDTNEDTSSKNQKRVAKDGANIQTENPDMPTRVIENGTKINMYFGDTLIPGVLNDSDTAKALIEMLPYTVHMNSYSHDFCGVMPDDLPYNEDEVHFGWLNGDIDYAIDAPYFTVLHSDEDVSERYDYQVNIGVITCELTKIRDLSGSYDVLIELAE